MARDEEHSFEGAENLDKEYETPLGLRDAGRSFSPA
jgi:hypothetical protein